MSVMAGLRCNQSRVTTLRLASAFCNQSPRLHRECGRPVVVTTSAPASSAPRMEESRKAYAVSTSGFASLRLL